MNSVITIDNMPTSGELSIKILKPFWTSEKILSGIKSGSLALDSLGDNSMIRDSEGRVIASVRRSTMAGRVTENTNVSIKKSKILPYLFIMDSVDELMELCPDANFKKEQVLIAGRHPEGSRHSYIFAIIKKDDGIYAINRHIENEYGVSRDTLMRIFEDTLNDWIDYPESYMREYTEILQEIIMPMLK